MKNKIIQSILGLMFLMFLALGCKSIKPTSVVESKNVPSSFINTKDTTTIVDINWKQYFSDEYLIALIDTALKNNQELNVVLQEIEISKNEIRARKGEYLPFVNLGAGAGAEKEGEYTRHGAVDEQLEIKHGTAFPEPLTDYKLGAYASWEIDVWKKLRNAKKSAVSRYLASIEGKNFMITNLIAEIAETYYDLMALDNSLEIIESNIRIQSEALKVVRQQKNAARVSQLAVNRFEAQLLNTQNLQYQIKQRIVEAENHINFLTGRFPNPIKRNSMSFIDLKIDSINSGIPPQLLQNRPDIRQAEFNLAASKLDVKVARAKFYPSLDITTGLGFQAFNPTFLFNTESMLFNFAGDLVAPLINRNAIKAELNSANAKQIQAVYLYKQSILNAYVDVLNQLNKVDNFSQSFETKNKEVNILNNSISIANILFNSAKADYTEVLLTQREALEAKMDLIEIKSRQLSAKVNIYRALGGGWN